MQHAKLSVAVTPASATQVKFTASSSSLTMYAGSGIGATWAGYFNSFCPGGPTFSTVGTSSNSMAGRTCLHVSSPAFVFPTFPADGTEFYDVLSLDSKTAPTAILTSTTINLFMMGQYSTYPTTQDFSYGF